LNQEFANVVARGDILKLENSIALMTSAVSLFEVLGKILAMGKKTFRGFSNEGIYKVLDYQSTLEILDSKGKKAKFAKLMVVKYLQDNVATFTDFGWSDGNGLRNYKVSPGYPVDGYKSGHREYVLISLRKKKNRGQTDTFRMQWVIKDGFLKPTAYWQTDVTHRFSRMEISVILPNSRPPSNVYVEESNTKKTHHVPNVQRLPGGRWKLSWRLSRPRLFEQYILKWEW